MPTERLATLRELFFARPRQTLGGYAHVHVQSRDHPENVMWIDRIFDVAEQPDAPAVAIGMQADMWDGPPEGQTAFIPIKGVLADRAARFGKPVLLLQGDSHSFLVDTPAGMPANLTRLVVQGSDSVPHEWLRLTIDPGTPGVFSCENVAFGSGAVTPCPAPLAP